MFAVSLECATPLEPVLIEQEAQNEDQMPIRSSAHRGNVDSISQSCALVVWLAKQAEADAVIECSTIREVIARFSPFH
jgi:hypothetical protein